MRITLTHRTSLPLVLVSLVALSTGLSGQQPDSTIAHDIAPGVVHRRIVFNKGPWKINVLEVNLRQPGISIRGSVHGRSTELVPPGNGLTLYTPAFGDSTPSDSTGRHPLSIQLKLVGREGDTMIFQRVAPATEARIALGNGGALAAEGTSRAELRQISHTGRNFRIVGRLTPHGKGLRTVTGGWPRLVLHGKSVADSADKIEGTFPRFAAEKHPRTAVGFSRDSTRLFLVTVDGRSESASGVSLVELAGIMLDLGAYEAMNFDGGGSTTMVVNGKLVSSPSDKGGERAVGSGLLVVMEK